MGDETGVPATIPVRHAAAKNFLDMLPLVVVEPLGCHESDLNAQCVQADTPLSRPLRDQRQGRGIAEQHAGSVGANGGDKPVEVVSGHLKGGQQARAKQPVANQAHPVLGPQFNRRAPDHDLPVANVHAPPTGGAPFGGHVVTHPLLAQVENQRLAARAAGIETRQFPRVDSLEPVGVGAYLRLVHERQSAQVRQGADTVRRKPSFTEQVGEIRHAGADVGQEGTQAL